MLGVQEGAARHQICLQKAERLVMKEEDKSEQLPCKRLPTGYFDASCVSTLTQLLNFPEDYLRRLPRLRRIPLLGLLACGKLQVVTLCQVLAKTPLTCCSVLEGSLI